MLMDLQSPFSFLISFVVATDRRKIITDRKLHIYKAIPFSTFRPQLEALFIMRNLACAYRTICVFIFLSFAFHWSSAQTGTVKGIVKDPDGRPIQYANVLLLKSSDSS